MNPTAYLNVFFKRKALTSINSSFIASNPLCSVFLSLSGCLLALEILARCFLLYFPLPMLQVDIQNPAILAAKLKWFDKHKGPKVAIIGDSIVYGETMAKYGNRNWENQTLSHQVANALSKTKGRKDILIMNLGMNGLLPVEMLKVGQIISALNPNAIIINIGLRSFSADFNKIETMYSRPWLKNLTWKTDKGLYWASEKEKYDPLYNIENRVRSFIEINSTAYQCICIMKAYLLKENLLDWVSRQKKLINAFLNSRSLPLSENNESDLVLLLKLKQRYRTISFSPDSVQANALRTILQGLWPYPTILFYTNEDPSKINQVLSIKKLETLRRELEKNIMKGKINNKNLFYIPPIEKLNKSHFLDLVHVNAEGYRIYTDALVNILGGCTYGSTDDHNLSCRSPDTCADY